MIQVEISHQFVQHVDEQLITQAAQATLDHAGVTADPDLTIVVSDDEQLRGLNQQFRGIDAPTDVLSFPADEIDPDTHVPYLGDIILSYPRAAEQAAAGGHPVSAELQLLVVHGVLHLLGHDHAEPEQQRAMWAAQAAVLTALGAPIRGPSDASC